MKTIVISDIPLGIGDKFAEIVKNKPLSMSFLKKFRKKG